LSRLHSIGHILILLSLCTLAFDFAACSPHKAEQAPVSIPLLQSIDDSVSIEAACKIISLEILSRLGDNDTGAVKRFFQTVGVAGDSLAAALGKNAATLVGSQAILDVVYRKWGMTFDRRDDDMEALLPHSAFKGKKGNCMAVSLMVLMLAERAGCPVGGVVLPGHFFCRFDDGRTPANIEPNRGGYSHGDDYYRSQYLSNTGPRYTLQTLKRTETIGVFSYAAGTLFLRKNDPGFAAALLRECCRRFPSLVEAEGNHALALALCGRSDTALTMLEALYRTYPSTPNLAANYGAVAMAAGRHKKAFEVYKAGLTHYPNDPKLLAGLSQAYMACQSESLDSLKFGR
jgi:hypothetical protein